MSGSLHQPIYNVKMEQCAHSTTGELASLYVSECIAVIVLFDNKSVFIEHSTDADFDNGKQDGILGYLDKLIAHIQQYKDDASGIQNVFMFGGCANKEKQKLKEVFFQVRDSLREPPDFLPSPSDLTPVDHFALHQHIIETTWSMKHEQAHGRNEPSVDIAITHSQNTGQQRFFLRQCCKLENPGVTDALEVHLTPGHNVAVFIAGLMFPVPISQDQTDHKSKINIDAQYWIDNTLIKTYENVPQHLAAINDCIKELTTKAHHLGAHEITVDGGQFMHFVNKTVFDRLTNSAVNGVTAAAE